MMLHAVIVARNKREADGISRRCASSELVCTTFDGKPVLAVSVDRDRSRFVREIMCARPADTADDARDLALKLHSFA